MYNYRVFNALHPRFSPMSIYLMTQNHKTHSRVDILSNHTEDPKLGSKQSLTELKPEPVPESSSSSLLPPGSFFLPPSSQPATYLALILPDSRKIMEMIF